MSKDRGWIKHDSITSTQVSKHTRQKRHTHKDSPQHTQHTGEQTHDVGCALALRGPAKHDMECDKRLIEAKVCCEQSHVYKHKDAEFE